MTIRKLMVNVKPNCECKSCNFYPFFHFININQLKFHQEFKDAKQIDIEFIKHMDSVEAINHTTGQIYQFHIGGWQLKEKFHD